MTSRRANRRDGRRERPQPAPGAGEGACRLPLTEEEIAWLDDCPSMSLDGEMQTVTDPGCDRSSHREYMAALMMRGLARGRVESCYDRMPCGCRIKVIGGTVEWQRS